MLVKIIRGSYGHRPDENESRVVRKDSKSPVFELRDEEAKRIIALGIAKASNPEDALDIRNMEMPQMTAAEIMSMDFKDMRKLAKEYGLDSKGTKEELSIRLKGALLKENVSKEDDVFVDEDEEPPRLEAQEPV